MSSFLQQNNNIYDKLLNKISIILFFIGTLLIPLFYLPFTIETINLPKQLLLYFLVLSLLLVWVIKIVVSKELIIKRTIFDVPLVVFVVATLVSSALSLSPVLSFLGRADIFLFNSSTVIALVAWFWLFLQLIDNKTKWKFMISALLFSFALSCLYFVASDLPLLASIKGSVGFNTINKTNAIFGIYAALGAIISFGLVSIKRMSWQNKILPFITGLLSLFALLKLGFTISWIILAVGMSLLLIIGTTLLAETSVPALSVNFILFLFALIFIFFSSPDSFKAALPVEVTLSFKPSFSIVADSFLSSAKTFLFGSGPGTFIYDFTSFKSASFNINNFVWSTRFQYPSSSILAILGEFGLVGFVGFLFIFLLALGSALGGWLKTRPSVWKKTVDTLLSSERDTDSTVHLEIFVIVAAWITSSVALFLVFYGLVSWWLWWWLLGIMVVGLSTITPGILREKKILLKISPQYSLALSFSFILLVTALIIFGVFSSKIYLAEVYFTKATKAVNLDEIEDNLVKAISLRSNYADYYIALARVSLQKARIESLKPEANPENMATLVANAVNAAKIATNLQPNNIETWETLTVMYMNARSFVSEANLWAYDAVKRANELEPTNPVLYWYKGNIEVVGQNLEDAKESYKKSIELKPDYIVAYNSLSAIYEAQGEIDKAINVYTPILSIVNNNPEILFNLGRLFYNRNEGEDDKKAEILWLRAVSISPDYSNALYSLGLLYERRGQRKEALKYFKQVEELNPDNKDIGDKIEKLLYAPAALPTQ